MKINEDIFECAANSLNLRELRVTLEEHNITFSMKDKKHEIIDRLLNLIHDDMMPEELYLSVRTKAFSESSNSNEGFYYKYSSDSVDFKFDKFNKLLEEEMENDRKSKHGTNIFKYSVSGMEHNGEKKTIKFIFTRETNSRKYDYVDKEVKTFNEIIKVNVQINYEYGLLYIQSKNFNNSKAVKFFLEKVINKLRIDTKDNVKLDIPKFDGQIVSKWASENKIDIKGISSMTIHMLDLLSEFENEDNNFTGYCMKKIYFGNDEIIVGNELIDNTKKQKEVKGSIFFGDDIKECIEISEGIVKGKKINGFEIQGDYLHIDEELGEEPEIVQVPITILQESNSTVRIAISKEMVTIDKNILSEIYECIRKVFLSKLNCEKINNTNEIISFINRAKEILNKEGVQAESKRDKAITI